MKRFKLIVPSFIAIIFCMLLIAGSTFALFTSEATASVAVTSGKVKIEASLGQPTLYSADATLTEGDLAGTILATDEENGKYAGTYYFKEQTGAFANGGTASKDGNTLTLDRMTPGDKVKAGLAITNSSNVKIKYRLTLEAHATGKNNETNKENAELLKVLKVKFFDKTYTGLQKFVSAWMYRDAVTTSEQLDTGLEIELPLEAGNDYQGLTVSYTILVEAVQANAKTTDAGVTEYVNNTTTQTGTDSKKVEATQTESVVLETTTAPQEEKTTTAEFTNAFNIAEQGSEVKLDVETASFETASQTSYTVVAQDATPVASVDLNLTVDGETVTAFKEGGSSKITTYVLKGLNDISVVYNGDNTKAFGAGQTTSRKDYETEVTAVGDYFYDSATGKLVFVTDHFSEYVPVTKDALTFINMTQSKAYSSGTFQTVLNEAAANDQINVMKDTSMNAPLMVSKSIKIEGNNHKFTSTGNRAVRIDTNNVSLEINNLDIIGGSGCERGVQIDLAKEKCEILLNNVNITGISAYAINVCDNCVDTNIEIKKSHIEAWGAINLWSDSYSVLIEDSELVGINSQPYNAWNNFGVVVLEGDTTGETTTHSSNIDVTIKNTKIRGGQTTGNKQWLIVFNNPSTYNTVSLINCELLGLDDSKVELVKNCGLGNKLYIDGVDYEAAEWKVKSVVKNNDNISGTVTYEMTANSSITRSEQVSYLTAQNIGAQTADTTFDLYCGEEKLAQGVTFTSLFNHDYPHFEFSSGKNVLEFPACDIYFTGDTYTYSQALFMIGAKDNDGNPTTRLIANGTSTVGKKGFQINTRNEYPNLFYFENIIFDGSQQNASGWGHLFLITAHNTTVEFNNVLFANFNKTGKTSVIGVWTNQAFAWGSDRTGYPTKEDNFGTTIRLTNCRTDNCNKPFIQFQGFEQTVIDAQSDCYSFISFNYDEASGTACGLNTNAAYCTQSANALYDNGVHYYWTVNGQEVISANGTTVVVFAE